MYQQLEDFILDLNGVTNGDVKLFKFTLRFREGGRCQN